MKKIFSILLALSTLVAVSTFTSCHEPDAVIDQLELDRTLSPIQFKYSLDETKVNATFSWTAMKGSTEYYIQILREDGSTYAEDILTYDPDTAESTTMTIIYDELPSLTNFSARLTALSDDPNLPDSKPEVIEFKTGLENLFLNSGKVDDADVTATTATVRWKAGAVVTHLDVTPDLGMIELTPEEIAAGVYEFTGLTMGKTYVVKLYAEVKDAYRGTCSFVASDKIDVSIDDKTATTITLGWGSDVTVTAVGIRLGEDEEEVPTVTQLTPDQLAACSFTFTGLTPKTEYRISAINGDVECAAYYTKTLGVATLWNFTTWEVATWAKLTTVNDLAIMADTGKEMYIKEDTDFGGNKFDFGGSSTITGKPNYSAAPTQRAVQFSVAGEGVIAIDCYANAAGRNFYAWVDVLGKFFGPVAAPGGKENRGKIFIPCPDIPKAAKVFIFADATINHVYSIEWYPGTEAPGQHAEKLATPVVAVDVTTTIKGQSTAVKFSWGAVTGAATYEYRIPVTKVVEGADVKEMITGTITGREYTISGDVMATLKPGTYTMSVAAIPATQYKYAASSAGTAAVKVKDTKLAAPVVKLDPATVTQGKSKTVTATWAAVEDAGSYDVSFNGGAVTNVAALTYTITGADVKALAEGAYDITVVAKPAAAPFEDSAEGKATLTVAPAGEVELTTLTWDFSDATFDTYAADIKTDNSTSTYDKTWNGLRILAGGGTFKVGPGPLTTDGPRYIQMGGAGSKTKRVVSFTAPSSGTLKVTASHTSDTGAAGRNVVVQVGEPDVQMKKDGSTAGKKEPAILTFDVEVTAATTVYIWTDNSLILWKIEYVYEAPEEEPAGTNMAWGEADFIAMQLGFGGASATGDINQASLTSMTAVAGLTADADGFTYKGLSYIFGTGKCKFGNQTNLAGTSALRLQFGGGGTKEKQCLVFTVDSPGSLVVEALGADARYLVVATDSAEIDRKNTTTAAANYTYDCSSVAAGSKIYIFSSSSAINIFSITWTAK